VAAAGLLVLLHGGRRALSTVAAAPAFAAAGWWSAGAAAVVLLVVLFRRGLSPGRRRGFAEAPGDAGQLDDATDIGAERFHRHVNLVRLPEVSWPWA